MTIIVCLNMHITQAQRVRDRGVSITQADYHTGTVRGRAVSITQADHHTGTESQRLSCIHHTGGLSHRHRESETELYRSHRQIITQAQSETELYPSHRWIITQAQSETELYPSHRQIQSFKVTQSITSWVAKVNDACCRVLTHNIQATKSRRKTRNLFTTRHIDPR